MPTLLRHFLLVLIAGLTLAACGGDDSGGGGGGESVDALLQQTFSGDKKVEKGKLDIKLNVNVKGGAAPGGPITLALTGPFESQGDAKLPKFKFEASFSGAGTTFNAGATSTGDKGFVKFQGQDYAISDQIFAQFRTAFEQAQKSSSKEGADNPSLATLGIDPRKWLTNPQKAGEAKVGDDDTIKITGGVDVSKLLDDLNGALDKTRSLGVAGAAELPTKITEGQKKQIADAVKKLNVEIYTGSDDKILRRMVIALGISAPKNRQGIETADINFTMSLLDVNEAQEIAAPANTKPFDQLLQGLGSSGLGALGGLGGSGGGGSSSGGSGSGSSGSGSSGSGGSNDALEKYSKCVEAAGNDTAKAQECAALLTQ